MLPLFNYWGHMRIMHLSSVHIHLSKKLNSAFRNEKLNKPSDILSLTCIFILEYEIFVKKNYNLFQTVPQKHNCNTIQILNLDIHNFNLSYVIKVHITVAIKLIIICQIL